MVNSGQRVIWGFFINQATQNDGNDDLNPLVDSGDVIGRQFESACQFPQLGCIL